MEEFVKCDYLPNGYTINKLGQVKNSKNKILKSYLSNSGYLFFNLKEDKKQKGIFLHRALAFAFIEKDSTKDFVNHIDGNKLNNNLSNLEWCTKSENTKHCYKLGLKIATVKDIWKGKTGKLHNRSKKVICVEDGKEYGSMSEAERYYGLGQSSVSWSIKHKKPIFGMHFEIGS